MRKLGSIEPLDDFILALASGANVNGTWRGSALVEFYFTESMRHFVVFPTEQPKSEKDNNILKLRAIINAGADVSPLFHSAYDYYEFGNLLRLLCRQLELLKVVIESEQTQTYISENIQHKNQLIELHDQLKSAENFINNMNL